MRITNTVLCYSSQEGKRIKCVGLTKPLSALIESHALCFNAEHFHEKQAPSSTCLFLRFSGIGMFYNGAHDEITYCQHTTTDQDLRLGGKTSERASL